MIDTVSRPKMFDGVGYKGKLGFVLITPGLSEIPEVSAQKYIRTEIFRELTQIVLLIGRDDEFMGLPLAKRPRPRA